MGTKAAILIVDDDPRFRKTLCDILKAEGHALLAVAKGKTALNRVKGERPAIAIIDLKLPDMDGLEVMREIKRRSPDTECIVLTGYASQASAIEAVNLGAYSYMQKPYDVGQLVLTIGRAIEKREAEEALRESEEKYRSVVEDSIDGIAIVQGLEIRLVNPALLKMFGCQSEDGMVGHTFTDFVSPEYRNLMAERGRAREEGKDVPSRYEFKAMCKDGTEFDAELSVRRILYQGSVARQGIVRDITERKRAEEALRESESRLSSILSSMADLVVVFDNEGRFIFYHCPLPSLDLLYMPPEKFMGKRHSEVMPLYIQKPFAKAFNKNKKGEVAEYEYWLEVGGETKWYSVKLSPMLLDDEFGGSVAVIRDITKRKQAEEALKSTALETLEALSRLVEANDPYTSGHSAMVTEVAIKIARQMGLKNRRLDALRIAGPLHDVGKVGIPSSILNKPTGLTQAEWVMIRAHPQVSASVAQQVTAFEAAVSVIRHHHERWDGTGYPDGLKGEDIPLLARILAVADGFQAMISERPYRRARAEEEALAELEKGAGTQWDPEVVKVFLKLRRPPPKKKGKGKRKRRK